MPLYIADYLSATEHLDASQSGAYLHLIMHYWQKGKLPQEDKFLARIARMTDRQWVVARPTIKAFFSDDWRHDRIDSELAHAQSKAEARAASGSRGGKSKSLKNKQWRVANANHSPQRNGSKLHSESLPSSSGLDLVTASAVEREGRARAHTPAFLRFWERWPNKVGKPDAEKAFHRVEGEIDAIMSGLERYVRDKPPDRSWLNPSTFLNNRRWEDEPASVFIQRSQNEPDKSTGNALGRLRKEFVERTEPTPTLKLLPGSCD